MDKKFVFDNEICNFYTSTACKLIEKECTTPATNNPKLIGHKVYICQDKKTKTETYVLFNKKGEAIADSYTMDGLAIKIEMLRFLKKFK